MPPKRSDADVENALKREQLRTKVLQLYRDGEGYGAIGEAVGASKSTVQYIVKNFGDRQTVKDIAKKGRPVKCSVRYVYFLPFNSISFSFASVTRGTL